LCDVCEIGSGGLRSHIYIEQSDSDVWDCA